MIEEWMVRMERAWKDLSNRNPSKVQIFHHNDTDGLTSGAILTEAFKRKGYTVQSLCSRETLPGRSEENLYRKREKYSSLLILQVGLHLSFPN